MVIYKYLENLIKNLYENPLAQTSLDQSGQSDQSPSVEKEIEKLSKNLIRIARMCNKIQSDLEKILLRSRPQTETVKDIIRDSLMQMFINSQCKEVIQ